MKSVVQRVREASVTVEGEAVGSIDAGILVLLGVERGDSEQDAIVLATKLAGLRIFPGERPMDRSLADIEGSALVVSQFTLAASVRKGRRPGFDRAEDPTRAEQLYGSFCAALRKLGVPVQTGRFGAHMDVRLLNDGPVTLLVDCRDGAIVG
ncbi:MAG: D-tyrosyl-tRNA(Tyr) deacylase [Nannocystaceae bacterium]|nr:D-tyrosyl-tRNA(Tyr) deacylase [Nannocystaceae bacterium]